MIRLQIQRLGLFIFGNLFIILSVLGYEKSIAETILYLADNTTGAWQQMTVAALCFIAGNIFIITGARMRTTTKEVTPTILTETLPDKLE